MTPQLLGNIDKMRQYSTHPYPQPRSSYSRDQWTSSKGEIQGMTLSQRSGEVTQPNSPMPAYPVWPWEFSGLPLVDPFPQSKS